MSGYPLGALLRLRRHAFDETRREMGLALTTVRAEEAERERLRAESRELAHRAEEAPIAFGGAGALQQTARFRAHLRAEAEALRVRLDAQDSRVREAELAAEVASRGLALAAAEHEAVVSHRRRWLEGRRAAREACEERDADDWVCSRLA